MLSFHNQLRLQIMFAEMFEKCKNGNELDDLIELITSIVENVGKKVREEQDWK